MRRPMTVALVLACSALLTALVRAQSSSVRLSVELPDNPMTGARLFVAKECVRCHGLGGSQLSVGPDLGRIRLPGSVLDLAGTFWNHSPVMREKMRDLKIQRPVFNTQEMTDLVAFLTAYRYYLTRVGQPSDPVAGRALFGEKQCQRCHGPGWNKPGPNLDRYRGRFSAIFLAQTMWNHGWEMAAAMEAYGVPWPKFSGGEMGDLLAYLQAGDTGGSAERVYFEPGSPRRGRELFGQKRCSACHAVAGTGGRGGPDLGALGKELMGSVASIAGLMWNHTRGMAREFTRRDIPPVVFSGQEMADIIAYLYFVNYATVRGTPDRGATLFANKCSTCHVIGGTARVGPDLAAAPGLDQPIAIITAMWNHAPLMEQELQRRGMAWPRFEPGDAADLAAFLLTQRVSQGQATRK